MARNWLSEMEPLIKNCDLVGTPGCSFLHLNSGYKVCHWPGYEGRRAGESIGIGRLISRQVLERLQFKPFDERIDSSLDYSMIQKCTKVSAKIHLTDNTRIKSLSISTDNWVNKHQYSDHEHGLLKSIIEAEPVQWLSDNFPEAFKVFE